MLRVVVDTNVIVSGLFWQGPPKQLYHGLLNGQFNLLLTELLLDELRDVVTREKFKARFAAIGFSPSQFLLQYAVNAIMVEPADIRADAVRDAKDRAVLGCAVGGEADFVVTGDNDLLVLKRYQSIPIVKVTEFLGLIGI
jgi:putative PIN family toxin of toxin-antitoxin system